MIVIVSDHAKEDIGTRLYEYCKVNGLEAEFVSASNAFIKPCFGCQGCTFQSYGKCVFRDDMDYIMPLLIEAEHIVYTTPLTYGTFSYNVKKIIDKMALMGDRYYFVKHGELVKGCIGRLKKITGIAVAVHTLPREKECFEKLMHEMTNIINVKCGCCVISNHLNEKQISVFAQEVFGL